LVDAILVSDCTMADMQLACANWFFHVGEFLDFPDVAKCEQARLLCPSTSEQLWHQMADTYLWSLPYWGQRALHAMQTLQEESLSPKSLILELKVLGQTLFPPESWQPWICKTSQSSLRASPLGRSSLGDDSGYRAPPATLPRQASIAVSTGAARGQSLVVGAKVTCQGPAHDSVCFGVEATGHNMSSRTMSVMLAPFSGQCFIQHGQDGPMMMAEVLPTVSEHESVIVWIQVTAFGGVRFLRQVGEKTPEEAGYLPPDCLPRWICQYFGCIHFWCHEMAAKEVNVSIEYSASQFPPGLDVPAAPDDTTDAVWSLVEDGE